VSDLDEEYMAEALKEAEKAFEADEVPIGAVLVHNGLIIARAHNQVESLRDASAHAELLCLRQAAKEIGNWRLTEATLYSTLEPCSMCAGALFSFRIGCLVWGAQDFRQGADGSWISLLGLPHPIHQFEVRRGILADRSSSLLKSFFQNKREQHVRANV
jgi:tRNA(adenine34) deaminase